MKYLIAFVVTVGLAASLSAGDPVTKVTPGKWKFVEKEPGGVVLNYIRPDGEAIKVMYKKDSPAVIDGKVGTVADLLKVPTTEKIDYGVTKNVPVFTTAKYREKLLPKAAPCPKK